VFERIDIRKFDLADQATQTDFVKNSENRKSEKISAGWSGTDRAFLPENDESQERVTFVTEEIT